MRQKLLSRLLATLLTTAGGGICSSLLMLIIGLPIRIVDNGWLFTSLFNYVFWTNLKYDDPSNTRLSAYLKSKQTSSSLLGYFVAIGIWLLFREISIFLVEPDFIDYGPCSRGSILSGMQCGIETTNLDDRLGIQHFIDKIFSLLMLLATLPLMIERFRKKLSAYV